MFQGKALADEISSRRKISNLKELVGTILPDIRREGPAVLTLLALSHGLDEAFHQLSSEHRKRVGRTKHLDHVKIMEHGPET